MTNTNAISTLLIWVKKIAGTSYAKNMNTMNQIKRMIDYKQLDANLSQISTIYYHDWKI